MAITENWLRRFQKSLYEYRPRFRERNFWVVQAMIILIAALHYYAEYLGLLEQLGALYFLTVVVFFIPLVYAALHFGFVGSLSTTFWVLIVTTPDWAVWHYSLETRLGVILPLLLVTGLSVFIGQQVDHEKTARRKAETSEDALKVSEIKYRHLFETSPVPVLVLDPSGNIIETNPAANLLLEASGNKQIHGNLSDLIGSENSQKLINPSENNTNPSETMAVQLKNGQIARIKPILTGLDSVKDGTAIQAVLRDVTVEYNRQLDLRAYAASITRTQEEERQRIARELHDDTLQSLVLLCRRLDSVETIDGNLSQPVIHELSEARKTAITVVNDLREFTTSLRPPALEDLGLIAAIRSLVRELSDRSKIKAGIKVTGNEIRLPPDTELGIFRISQEALWNAERHSKADRIEVTLAYTKHEVKLEISDNGTGFKIPRATSELAGNRHLGIIGMRERAILFGGNLRVESTSGKGTRIIAALLLTDEAHDNTGIL